ncbi:hypothetical protein BDZ89DRAFT_1080491, partial [Hymenopellis radicata]
MRDFCQAVLKGRSKSSTRASQHRLAWPNPHARRLKSRVGGELILGDKFSHVWRSKFGRSEKDANSVSHEVDPDLVEFPEPEICEKKEEGFHGQSLKRQETTATPYLTSRTNQMCPSWRVVRVGRCGEQIRHP